MLARRKDDAGLPGCADRCVCRGAGDKWSHAPGHETPGVQQPGG